MGYKPEEEKEEWKLILESITSPSKYGISWFKTIIVWLYESLDEAKNKNPTVTAEGKAFKFQDKNGRTKYLLIKVASKWEDLY